MMLTDHQRNALATWRKDSLHCDHLQDQQQILTIQQEIQAWPQVRELGAEANFFEVLALCDHQGNRTGTRAWRGVCHWLWLRHECVDGMLFTPGGLAVIQERSPWVVDSPGFLEMSFAGHVGTSAIRATTRAAGPQALESEAWGEAGIDLFPDSPHVRYPEDREPIATYAHVDPPKPDLDWYNAEFRRVFAVRLTDQGAGALQPRDREVACFQLLPFVAACAVFLKPHISSSLRVSGPLAVYHAMQAWGWGL